LRLIATAKDRPGRSSSRARDEGIEEEYLVFESISDPAVDESDSGLSKTVRAVSQQLFGTSNHKRN